MSSFLILFGGLIESGGYDPDQSSVQITGLYSALMAPNGVVNAKMSYLGPGSGAQTYICFWSIGEAAWVFESQSVGLPIVEGDTETEYPWQTTWPAYTVTEVPL